MRSRSSAPRSRTGSARRRCSRSPPRAPPSISPSPAPGPISARSRARRATAATGRLRGCRARDRRRPRRADGGRVAGVRVLLRPAGVGVRVPARRARRRGALGNVRLSEVLRGPRAWCVSVLGARDRGERPGRPRLHGPGSGRAAPASAASAAHANPAPPSAPTPKYRRSVVVKPTSGRVCVRLPGTAGTSTSAASTAVRWARATTCARAASACSPWRVEAPARRPPPSTAGCSGSCSAARSSRCSCGGRRRAVARERPAPRRTRGSARPACGDCGAAARPVPHARPLQRGERARHHLARRGRLPHHHEDGCRTTTTRVMRGSVSIRDFRLRRTIVLRSGERYIARRR